MMFNTEIHTDSQLIDFIHQIGFLPLLNSGITGYSAEDIVDDDCRYCTLPDGTFYWPLWQWKGTIVTEGDCMYGKFFDRKAGFISKSWWPDFFNYRRAVHPAPEPDSIEDTILATLHEHGSLITRELRALCGFTGAKMRGKFDTYVTRLQMGCHIVTEDFVYPRDRHNREYGWGWSLLTTPEQLYGRDACHTDHTPQESYILLLNHFHSILPTATEKQIKRLIG